MRPVRPTAMSPFVMPVHGLLARPDGNNVNLEREALLLAQVQLQFKSSDRDSAYADGGNSHRDPRGGVIMNLFRCAGNQRFSVAGRAGPRGNDRGNLANAETTQTETGGPYQRMNVVFGARPVPFQGFGESCWLRLRTCTRKTSAW